MGPKGSLLLKVIRPNRHVLLGKPLLHLKSMNSFHYRPYSNDVEKSSYLDNQEVMVVPQLIQLFRKGKDLDASGQRKEISEIVTLLERAKIESLLEQCDLNTRKTFWTLFVSTKQWKLSNTRFDSIFMEKWAFIMQDSLILDSCTISNMLNSLSKAKSNENLSMIAALASKINSSLEMNGEQVTNSLIALSRMKGLNQPEILSGMVCLAEKINPSLEMNGEQVTNSLIALSRMNDVNQPAILSAFACLAEKINSNFKMSGQQVTTLLIALSRMKGLNQPEIISALVCLAEKIKSNLIMSGEQVSKSSNVSSKMNDEKPAIIEVKPELESLFLCLATKIKSGLKMSGMEVSHSLKIISKMKNLDRPEIISVIVCLAKKINSGRIKMNGDQVSNSMNALSKMKHLNEPEINAALDLLAAK